MGGDFAAKMEALEARIGDGDLVGSVTFSGAAAAPQHEHVSRFSPPSWAKHPVLTYTTPGTGVKYLSGPLLENYPRYLEDIARRMLRHPRGPVGPMVDAMNDLRDKAARKAPKEHGDLAGSAEAHVTDDGERVG